MRFVLAAAVLLSVISVGQLGRSCLAHEVTYNGPAHSVLKHVYKKPAPAAEPVTVFPRAYPWGYFGAQPTRQKVYHRGYYGDYYEWGYRRTY
jgi:hypothetical protein